MKKIDYKIFIKGLYKKTEQHKPLYGHIDLTYRCNFDCIHCYSKGLEKEQKELSACEWKNILDVIHKEGCLWLTLSGGEPLMRSDFLEIYAYAKHKGFLITIFTNASLFTKEIMDFLKNNPPESIEITINSITKKIYEMITNTPDSFDKAMYAVREMYKRKLPLVLKANGLKHNKNEISKIKYFCENLLGKNRFKFDSYVHPGLQKNEAISRRPIQQRLSPEEIKAIEESDNDMFIQRRSQFQAANQDMHNDSCLYKCNTWLTNFFIDPYARLKFCQWTDKYSVDVREHSFKEQFYRWPVLLTKRKVPTESKCHQCSLQRFCSNCPSRAFLESGNETGAVDYFCRLAKLTQQRAEENSLEKFAAA